MIKQFLRILFAGFLIFPGCVSIIPNLEIEDDASREDVLISIDQWLKDLLARRKFNGAILVTVDGKEELMNTYGFSDLARTRRLTDRSSFRTASVSKQFTAMAIMILKEQEKLKFDDQVQKYLQNFPYEDVTIRHLLTHTSGVPDHEK